jgi:hypothetical protein
MKGTFGIFGIVLATGLVAAAPLPAAAQAVPAAPVSATGGLTDAYFAGWLVGRNEVPRRGDRNGRAYVVIRISGDSVSYVARWSNIGRPTAFHIHQGKAGTTGGVKVGFFGEALPGSARAVSGKVTVTDRSLLAGIKRSPSRYYLNVHTGQFPDGAVRAQLKRIHRPVDMTRVLTGDTHPRLASYASGGQEVRERGKTVGDRDGTARWLIGVSRSKLSYTATWGNLDPVTNGHIHRGKRGRSGPLVTDLFADANGLPASVRGIAGVVSVNRHLARGFLTQPKNWYTNLHTTVFPDGAVRGQLRSARGSR